ncbi:MAG: hypothetical protein U0893_04110 [Chloroflexota bacterium]
MCADEDRDREVGSGRLTLAATSHVVSIESEVFEQASEVREFGVGVSPQPHAIKDLAALGLIATLDRTGIRARLMISMWAPWPNSLGRAARPQSLRKRPCLTPSGYYTPTHVGLRTRLEGRSRQPYRQGE